MSDEKQSETLHRALVASLDDWKEPIPMTDTQAADSEICQKCGHVNPSWVAPSPLWNAVMRGGSIDGEPLYGDMVCTACFIEIAEEKQVASGWRLTAQQVNVPLELVTPSGRVWDAEQFLWVDGLPTQSTMQTELEQIARDMEHAVGGGMMWIDHSEAVEFCRRIRSVAALTKDNTDD